MATELNEDDLYELYKFTKQLAKAAGALILQGSKAIREEYAVTSVQEKKNPVDLVTEWDVKVENYVQTLIVDRYPLCTL